MEQNTQDGAVWLLSAAFLDAAAKAVRMASVYVDNEDLANADVTAGFDIENYASTIVKLDLIPGMTEARADTMAYQYGASAAYIFGYENIKVWFERPTTVQFDKVPAWVSISQCTPDEDTAAKLRHIRNGLQAHLRKEAAACPT